MKALEILIAARNKIEKPENWTTDHTARDAKLSPVDSLDSAAVCWCSFGAMQVVCGVNLEGFEYNKAVDTLKNANNLVFVSQFNDTHTHDEVLKAFDKAIRYAAND